MSLLQNKHFRMALVIAPILGIVTYIGLDYTLSEQPVAATVGKSYPLAARSNCRYESGHCTLKNGDIELRLHGRPLDGSLVELKLTSELSVQRAVVSVSHGAESPELGAEAPVFVAPYSMVKADKTGNEWLAIVDIDDPAKSQLRLAATIEGTAYFVETRAIFVQYKTAAPMPKEL